MTVSSESIVAGPFIGNGIAASFSHSFVANNTNEIAVYRTDLDGVVTVLTMPTDFIWSSNGPAGGTLVLTGSTPLPVGFKLRIVSNRAYTQLTDFNNQGGFFPDVHEDAIDKLTYQILQLRNNLEYSFRVPTSGDTLSELPSAFERAGGILGFDSDGDIAIVDSLPPPDPAATLIPFEFVERTLALTPSDAGVDDQFGSAVALSNNGLVMAVGARLWDGAVSNQGTVYTFDWNGHSWIERAQKIIASDFSSNDYFGSSVALSGDGTVMVVGSPLWDGVFLSNVGLVYVFNWNGTEWVEVVSFEASDFDPNDNFGNSVALSDNGTVMAVGAPLWDGAFTNQGAVYVFDFDGADWVERTTALTPSDAGADDQFGHSVALSSNGLTMAVGSINWEGAVTDQGVVYVFDWDGSSWVERAQKIVSNDPVANDFLGTSVALSGDATVMAVGVRFWDSPGKVNEGGVFFFDWDGTTWVERAEKVTSSDFVNGFPRLFSWSVALSDDATIVAVGSLQWTGAFNTQGSVYVYDLTYAQKFIASANTGSPLPFSFSDDLDTGIDSLAPDTVSLMAGGVEVLTANNSGNVGIGTATPGASAILELSSTTKAFLPTRMTTGQRDDIVTPVNGMVLYNTSLNKLQVRSAGAWVSLH